MAARWDHNDHPVETSSTLDRPRRIQRQRTKGWRMPEGAVYVGRPTVWGNPFYVPGRQAGRHDGVVFELRTGIAVETREDSITAFRRYALERGFLWMEKLRGRDLACWCPLDQPCHADVLLELANR